MAITFTNGEITTTASEQDLFDITADKFFSCYLFLDLMTGSETFVIKVYVLDGQDSVMRIHTVDTIVGDQSAAPAFYTPSLPATQYKVTIQRTGGSDRAVSFRRIEAN